MQVGYVARLLEPCGDRVANTQQLYTQQACDSGQRYWDGNGELHIGLRQTEAADGSPLADDVTYARDEVYRVTGRGCDMAHGWR